jgi:hypothetical protein
MHINKSRKELEEKEAETASESSPVNPEMQNVPLVDPQEMRTRPE